jgi:hypothetical protein
VTLFGLTKQICCISKCVSLKWKAELPRKESLKAEADKAKERFTELANIKKEKEDAIKAEQAAKKPLQTKNSFFKINFHGR